MLVQDGTTLRVPWSITVPAVHRRLIGSAKLSSRKLVPSDADPAVLTVVAGRVDGSKDRPQLMPLEQLQIDLYRSGVHVGSLVRIREVLPGRYAFGITGRGPNGRRLRTGDYELKVVATAVGGAAADERTVPFTVP